MPTFTTRDPAETMIGRERGAAAARAPYVQAVTAWEAGRIDLEPSEIPSTVKRRLTVAAHAAGLRVRSSYVEEGRARYVVWKRTASKRATR